MCRQQCLLITHCPCRVTWRTEALDRKKSIWKDLWSSTSQTNIRSAGINPDPFKHLWRCSLYFIKLVTVFGVFGLEIKKEISPNLFKHQKKQHGFSLNHATLRKSRTGVSCAKPVQTHREEGGQKEPFPLPLWSLHNLTAVYSHHFLWVSAIHVTPGKDLMRTWTWLEVCSTPTERLALLALQHLYPGSLKNILAESARIHPRTSIAMRPFCTPLHCGLCLNSHNLALYMHYKSLYSHSSLLICCERTKQLEKRAVCHLILLMK